MKRTGTPLTGKALLQKIEELSHLSRMETAKQCGYVSGSGNSERVSLSNFYDAVLRAKGIALDPEESTDGRGRVASYRVKVQGNGQILIGPAYTVKEMGLKLGDEFEIKLGYKHIQLKQIGEGDLTEK